MAGEKKAMLGLDKGLRRVVKTFWVVWFINKIRDDEPVFSFSSIFVVFVFEFTKWTHVMLESNKTCVLWTCVYKIHKFRGPILNLQIK